MVALPQQVNVQEQANQSAGIVLIPDGKYPAVFVTNEMKDNAAKTGKFILMNLILTSGAHKDTEFACRFNVINPNADAVRISYEQLANIGKALGLDTITDTQELMNKPLVVKVKAKKSKEWTNNDGEIIEGKDQSEVVGYYPMPSTGFIEAPVAQSVAETTVPPQSHQTAPQQAASPAVEQPPANPFAPPA